MLPLSVLAMYLNLQTPPPTPTPHPPPPIMVTPVPPTWVTRLIADRPGCPCRNVIWPGFPPSNWTGFPVNCIGLPPMMMGLPPRTAGLLLSAEDWMIWATVWVVLALVLLPLLTRVTRVRPPINWGRYNTNTDIETRDLGYYRYDVQSNLL